MVIFGWSQKKFDYTHVNQNFLDLPEILKVFAKPTPTLNKLQPNLHSIIWFKFLHIWIKSTKAFIPKTYIFLIYWSLIQFITWIKDECVETHPINKLIPLYYFTLGVQVILGQQLLPQLRYISSVFFFHIVKISS